MSANHFLNNFINLKYFILWLYYTSLIHLKIFNIDFLSLILILNLPLLFLFTLLRLIVYIFFQFLSIFLLFLLIVIIVFDFLHPLLFKLCLILLLKFTIFLMKNLEILQIFFLNVGIYFLVFPFLIVFLLHYKGLICWVFLWFFIFE